MPTPHASVGASHALGQSPSAPAPAQHPAREGPSTYSARPTTPPMAWLPALDPGTCRLHRPTRERPVRTCRKSAPAGRGASSWPALGWGLQEDGPHLPRALLGRQG